MHLGYEVSDMTTKVYPSATPSEPRVQPSKFQVVIAGIFGLAGLAFLIMIAIPLVAAKPILILVIPGGGFIAAIVAAISGAIATRRAPGKPYRS